MAIVMDADRVSRSITRIAHEILERNRALHELALVGIRTRGVPIARRLAQAIRGINQHEVPTGAPVVHTSRTTFTSRLLGARCTRHPTGCMARRTWNAIAAAGMCCWVKDSGTSAAAAFHFRTS